MTKITITTDCQDEAKILLHAVEKAIAVSELKQKLRYGLKEIDFGENHNYIEQLYSLICEIDSIGE
jgi:hypothetical protein